MKKTLEEKRQNVAEWVGFGIGLAAEVAVEVALCAALPGAEKVVGKVVRFAGILCAGCAIEQAGECYGEEFVMDMYRFSDKIKEKKEEIKAKREDKKNGLEEVEVVA